MSVLRSEYRRISASIVELPKAARNNDNTESITMKTNPSNGIPYVLNGFNLIRQPGIKRYVIIPLVINILLFAGLFFLARHLFSETNHWLVAHLPSWLQWLGSILWIIFFIGFFLVVIYTFVTLANLVSAPFNSLLSEKVELYLTGKSLDNQNVWQMIKDTPRIIGRQFAILGYYLPRAIVLLILFFIPVVQIIAAFLWFLFNAWFMTLQYIDYPTDNRRIPFQKVRDKMNQKRMLSLTFGIGVLVLSMIPIINFIIMPAAVAGATQLWIEKLSR